MGVSKESKERREVTLKDLSNLSESEILMGLKKGISGSRQVRRLL
jgi:hypothetical protein